MKLTKSQIRGAVILLTLILAFVLIRTLLA